jgi:hypothetical protein
MKSLQEAHRPLEGFNRYFLEIPPHSTLQKVKVKWLCYLRVLGALFFVKQISLNVRQVNKKPCENYLLTIIT